MKLNPKQLTNGAQQVAYREARTIATIIDSQIASYQTYDQTEHDLNPAPGQLRFDANRLRDGVVREDTPTDWVTLTENANGGSEFEGPGTFRALDFFTQRRAFRAQINKTETPNEIRYKVRVKNFAFRGPNTLLLKIDKESGEWDYSKRWFGLVPGPITPADEIPPIRP